MKGLMVQGTASSVGKSLVCTAICRLLANEGKRVAPFKSQNMSSLSIRTEEGLEISVSQSLQARAAKTAYRAEMNPILLKPVGNMESDIIILGEKLNKMNGMHYREQFFEEGQLLIKNSLKKLSTSYEYLILEGAGSPVEVNLRERELVNMRIADLADVPVLLVANIEYGGVFASIVGTLALLPETQRARVKGIIINKFRGDASLFQDGIDFIESYTGIDVIGIVPYFPNELEEEDGEAKNGGNASDEQIDEWANHFKKHVKWEKIISILNGVQK
ncbi:cobyric acid synthase [Psychrobacillus sp. NEAU-3TGS]|uniref:cobyric acid synthase n=1 Tax=Psychrobacillus sp. NEAU-3TGS TaxID=2995412 RepID=UPI0024963A5F|nr:cobyric acid synthase [Psychrobacillus sp. NEAU-3TGS]MDI2587789.1 cobyric acid synthase [Psychrobacillus sp. NEAU-3TGS]